MTREEAIKTLKENYCAMCAYGSQDMDSCDIRSCDNKDAIKALEQEPKIGWIPVSEGLPEKNMECLVSVGDFNFTQMAMYSNLMRTIDHRIFYQGEYGKKNFKDITQYVKAWMPLPKAYKPQESEAENE